MKRLAMVFVILAALALGLSPAWAAGLAKDSPQMQKAQAALCAAMDQLKLKKSDSGFLVLTNAGYGEIGGQSTEAFLDIAAGTTGRSVGSKSLVAVHASCYQPLWFSLYSKEKNKLAFAKWSAGAFKTQVVDADPQKILTRPGWKKAAAGGVMGSSMFGVVSLSLAWGQGLDWPLLLSAAFHNHFCPGLNGGYVAAAYVKKHLPLAKGEGYMFVGAPCKCFMDALQVIFDATSGKSGAYGLPMSDKAAAKYISGKYGPLAIAMRVNKKKNICDGLVLGFNWVDLRTDCGVKDDEMAPKKGRADPMFFISRVKMSMAMAQMPMEKKLGYIKVFKKLSGPASLAQKVALGGGDPYAVAWGQ